MRALRERSLNVIIVIPDDIVQTSQLTEEYILFEIAVLLLERRRITLVEATRLVKMEQAELLQLLTERLIRTPFNANDVQERIEDLRKQGW